MLRCKTYWAVVQFITDKYSYCPSAIAYIIISDAFKMVGDVFLC